MGRHGLKLTKTGREEKETFDKVAGRQRTKSERKILNETKRDIGQLFFPVSERLQTAVDERASLFWGYSVCISISYSSQTDNVALCFQGQGGHSLPRAMTRHTHAHTNTQLQTLFNTHLCILMQRQIQTRCHTRTQIHTDCAKVSGTKTGETMLSTGTQWIVFIKYLTLKSNQYFSSISSALLKETGNR